MRRKIFYISILNCLIIFFMGLTTEIHNQIYFDEHFFNGDFGNLVQLLIIMLMSAFFLSPLAFIYILLFDFFSSKENRHNYINLIVTYSFLFALVNMMLIRIPLNKGFSITYGDCEAVVNGERTECGMQMVQTDLILSLTAIAVSTLVCLLYLQGHSKDTRR